MRMPATLAYPAVSLLAAVALSLAAAPLVAAQAAPAQQTTAVTPSSDSAILAAEHYVRPPAEIEKLVTAPRENNISLSHDVQSSNRRWFYKLLTDSMPSARTFGKPHYYLGELQVDYRGNRARSLTDRGFDAGQVQ